MIRKSYLVAALYLLAPFAHAANAPAPPVMQKGQVKAVLVQGTITLKRADGTTSKLQRNQTFEEGDVIDADKDALALLVFSNGSSMKVKDGVKLKVTQFDQASFDEAVSGTYLRLEKDPGKSVTKIDLDNGTIEIDVKDLNYANGSTFDLKTPAGSFGFRKTPSIFILSVTRDPKTGSISKVLGSCAIGNVAFIGSAGGGSGRRGAGGGVPVMPPGGQIQIIVQTDPKTGTVTGITVNGAVLSQNVCQNMVEEVYQAINEARTNDKLPPLATPKVTPATIPTGVPIVQATDPDAFHVIY